MPARLSLVSILIAVLAAPAGAVTLDSRASVERAVALIEDGQHALARVYLEPALIDPRLSAGERSRAYYIRGYSFYADGQFNSAAKDYHHALEFDPGNPVVLSAVAQLHLEGLGVDRNPALAVNLFQQAADAGLPEGQLRMGYLYAQGIWVEQDLDEARRWFALAAAGGSAQAMLQMAQTWRRPWAERPDPQATLEWLERAHAAGAVDALTIAGFMFENGEFGAPDPAQAQARFEAAAAAGSGLASAKLAHLYLAGDGVPQDDARALALFQAAAERGHPAGFMGLAYLYESGTGVPEDQGQALAWYRRAAAAGILDAQLRLAYSALGRGDLEGHREAAGWLALAAAQNDPQALNDYAWLLATSPHAELRDGTRALSLARRAVARDRSASFLDTLAAAYAELGLYRLAVATQEEALTAAPADAEQLVAELRAHLEAFQAGRPWRE